MFLLAGFPVFSTGGIDSMNVYAADKQEELQEYYVYRLEDGQLKYWLDLSGDEMKLHCMFMSGDPEYYERIYTFDADSAESSGRTVLLKKVTDDRGNDISDFFVMLSFTFVNDHAVMSVVRDEKTLAGGSSDNLLTGRYTMTPGKPDDAPDHSGSTGSSSKGALKIVEGLLTAEASADQPADQSADQSKIYTPDELCKMAQEYYNRHKNFYPPIADYQAKEGGKYQIHLYEVVDDGNGTTHTATSAWYTVDTHGVGTDDIYGEAVDLTK
jgi:hypothetical protein